MNNDPDLTEIDLLDKSLSDSHIVFLCEILKNNNIVKNLLLSFNKNLSNKSGDALLSLLETNKTIQNINLLMTEISDYNQRKIREKLRDNLSLFSLSSLLLVPQSFFIFLITYFHIDYLQSHE